MLNDHPILRWAISKGMTVGAVAKAAGCSGPHLYNIIAGRKEASLSLAKRLRDVTGGKVPMDAFLRPNSD